MSTSSVSRRMCAAVLAVGVGAALAACSSSTTSTPSSGMSGTNMSMGSSTSAAASATGMSGMAMSSADPMYTGTGLSASDGGFTFASVENGALAAGIPRALMFRILDSSGMTVTAFEPDQTKLMHFYLIRSDVSGFEHVHPTMADDGTWTASLPSLAPGTYRAYVAFNAKNASGATVAEVLSKQLTVPGTVTTTALPAVSASTTVDGYTLTVSGELMSGMSHPLKVSVSKGGAPARNLQPYLQTYAHLTAIHAGDLAFAHLHPEGTAAMTDTGGPDLTVQTTLPERGNWRFFVQFQTGGVLHTGAITLHAS